MKNSLLTFLLFFGVSLLVSGCAPRYIPSFNEEAGMEPIPIIPPHKFSIVEERLTPVEVRMKSDGVEPDFVAQLQQYVLGHVQSDVVRIVNGDEFDFELNISPSFSTVCEDDEESSMSMDCELKVMLTPANSRNAYATKIIKLTSLKRYTSVSDAKKQYCKVAGEELSTWTIHQLNAMNMNRINAGMIRVGLTDPIIQFDRYKQEKEMIEICNFIRRQKGVISSKIVEFDKEYRVATFRVVYFTNHFPNRFSELLTEQFQ